MQYCYTFWFNAVYEGNGRGGIRTHGGFPHARFRVECLKPDSATLPIDRRKRRAGFGAASVERATSNVACKCGTDNHVAVRVWSSAFRRRMWRALNKGRVNVELRTTQAVCASRGEKCYNLRLAKAAVRTASCISTRTATLLLVVDGYSQVLGAAVHQYCQLIRKPQPLPYRHDSTQTRNSARVTK